MACVSVPFLKCIDMCQHPSHETTFFGVTIPALKCIGMCHHDDMVTHANVFQNWAVIMCIQFATIYIPGWPIYFFEYNVHLTRGISCIDTMYILSSQITSIFISGWSHYFECSVALCWESCEVLSCIDMYHHMSSQIAFNIEPSVTYFTFVGFRPSMYSYMVFKVPPPCKVLPAHDAQVLL